MFLNQLEYYIVALLQIIALPSLIGYDPPIARTATRFA
jgi:hypothetical protein